MTSPLADRMRPSSLDEVVGQHHLLDNGKILRRIADSGQIPNMVFYGPSGVGKTTVARIIAEKTNMRLHKLNGTTASTSDIKDIISELNTFSGANGILLYLDEIQYFNKKQQQSLLEHLENGSITLIASTTENPYFYIYNAVLSRSTVFEFKPVDAEDIIIAIKRAAKFLSDETKRDISLTDEAAKIIAYGCGGDVRKSINAVEMCMICSPVSNEPLVIGKELAESFAQKSAMRYDRDGDAHYDIFSAYQKSMRGSDPDAALHYLGRLLTAGDLPGACRRLLVCACEDVGLAYPHIIPIVKACVDAALQVGMPEARIPLADATVLVATSPKSNSAYLGINAAMADIERGDLGDIPAHLKNVHCNGAGEGKHEKYKYAHDYKNHYVKQQYLPDNIKNRKYYEYGDNKNEQSFKSYWDKIK